MVQHWLFRIGDGIPVVSSIFQDGYFFTNKLIAIDSPNLPFLVEFLRVSFNI